jgi:hypothetical protein
VPRWAGHVRAVGAAALQGGTAASAQCRWRLWPSRGEPQVAEVRANRDPPPIEPPPSIGYLPTLLLRSQRQSRGWTRARPNSAWGWPTAATEGRAPITVLARAHGNTRPGRAKPAVGWPRRPRHYDDVKQATMLRQGKGAAKEGRGRRDASGGWRLHHLLEGDKGWRRRSAKQGRGGGPDTRAVVAMVTALRR